MADYYQNFIKDYPAYADDALIKKAFEIAVSAHEGQLRRSGEPYIIHPYEVVRILADMGLDSASICAGMLHDVPEDTDFGIVDVEKTFSKEIAVMVDGVTKLKKFEFRSREEAQAESMRKMFLAMAADIRVIIIKLADRLHNMRTLGYTSEKQQHEKAKETLEIYAPLAHRLGINAFKWEFEDLALKYLEPEAYFDIASKLKTTREERERYIKDIVAQLRNAVDKLNISYQIEGRPKHIYSIYKKMKNKMKTFEELYDLVAVRIIVGSVRDCYAILGTVHTIWPPLPMRFKDYIAVPKPNMYQSLHTTLLGTDGKPFEVQIRTEEMHRTAEYGIAAHWKYKDGTTAKQSDFDKQLTWIRELMEWQSDMHDSKEFVAALKANVFSDNVYVFTPKGDVKDFVKGSTPLDFAYGVHSQVGNKCIGAKVNGKLVPLNYELKSGDIVEILTSASSKGPSRDWLSIVKTATARSKIRAWFKKEGREENIRKGKELLEREAKRRGYDIHALMRPAWVKSIYKRYNLSSADDMYAALGFGGLTTKQVLSRLIEEYKLEHKESNNYNKNESSGAAKIRNNGVAVEVEGEPDMLVRLAHCCNPLPGDKIVGYITRGRGVTVHRADCSNLNDTDFQKERMVHVSWIGGATSKYEVEVQMHCDDRPGLLAEISQMLYLAGYSILSLNARVARDDSYLVDIKIEVSAMKDLETLMNKLRTIDSVTDVYRLFN